MNKKQMALLSSAATIAGLVYALYNEVKKINFDELDFNYEEAPHEPELDADDSQNQ